MSLDVTLSEILEKCSLRPHSITWRTVTNKSYLSFARTYGLFFQWILTALIMFRGAWNEGLSHSKLLIRGIIFELRGGTSDIIQINLNFFLCFIKHEKFSSDRLLLILEPFHFLCQSSIRDLNILILSNAWAF